MNPIEHSFIIDLQNRYNRIRQYEIKQFDTDSHKFAFTLLDNSVAYNLTGLTGKIYIKKPNGDEVFSNLTINSAIGGKLSFLLTTQCLTIPGTVEAEITLYGTGGEVLTSITFTYIVKPVLRDDEAIESTNEYTALTEALAEVQNIDNRFAEVNSQLEEKANITDVRMKQNLIGTGDITAELQSQIAGTAPVANSIPANQSVTVNTIADETFKEIAQKREYDRITEQKHGQLINLINDFKDGTFSTTNQTLDTLVKTLVDSDDNIPYSKKIVSKLLRLSYNNVGSTEKSGFWGLKVPLSISATNAISGFWLRKSDIQAFGSARLSPLVWMYNSSGTQILQLTTPIGSTPTVIVPGYTKTVTGSGVTLTFTVEAEYGDWYYCTQKVDVLVANTTSINFAIFIQTILASNSVKLDVLNFSILENQTKILPYFVYPENAGEKTKISTEISKNISDLQALIPTYPTINFGYNLETTLLKYRTSLSKRLSAIVTIACIGDSITEGEGSGGTDTLSYPVQLRKLLQTKYGGQDEGLVTAKDIRWVATGTWTNAKKGIALWQKSSLTNGSKLTFTFTGVAIDIIHSKNTDGGSCAVKIDGVDKTPLNCYNTTEIYAQSQSYAGLTSGSHTLEIYAPTDGKKVYVEGAYIKTVGDTAGVRVDRRGCAGSAALEWISTLQLDTFTNRPADLFILALGVNDCGAGKTPTQMKTSLQSIITRLKTLGSVIIVPVQQAASSDTSRIAWTTDYVPKFYELADENNIGLIDINKLYGDYPTAQSYGLFYDTLHLNANGYQLMTDTIFKLIG